MSRFHIEHDRILIVDHISENRAQRSGRVLILAICFACLVAVIGVYGRAG